MAIFEAIINIIISYLVICGVMAIGVVAWNLLKRLE